MQRAEHHVEGLAPPRQLPARREPDQGRAAGAEPGDVRAQLADLDEADPELEGYRAEPSAASAPAPSAGLLEGHASDIRLLCDWGLADWGLVIPQKTQNSAKFQNKKITQNSETKTQNSEK